MLSKKIILLQNKAIKKNIVLAAWFFLGTLPIRIPYLQNSFSKNN